MSREVQGWTYQGHLVRFNQGDVTIAPDWRPGGKRGHLVQQVLDELDPWEADEDPIETLVFDGLKLLTPTVRVGCRPLIWGIHVSHRMVGAHLSPFVRLQQPTFTSSVTIELSGPPNAATITRVYIGEYTPPLPWMASARDADGGRAACQEFWASHAFRYAPSLVQPGSQISQPPDWWLKLSRYGRSSRSRSAQKAG